MCVSTTGKTDSSTFKQGLPRSVVGKWVVSLWSNNTPITVIGRYILDPLYYLGPWT